MLFGQARHPSILLSCVAFSHWMAIFELDMRMHDSLTHSHNRRKEFGDMSLRYKIQGRQKRGVEGEMGVVADVPGQPQQLIPINQTILAYSRSHMSCGVDMGK